MVLSTQNLHLGNANVNLRFDHGMVSPAYKTYVITGCSVDLIAQWIKSDAAKRFFYNATTVGASVCRRNVEWDTLYEQSLYLPCRDEQEKVAKFLGLLSNRINKQQRFVSALKKYKRGLLQDMFPQKGEAVPKLRLAGFIGAWEQRKVSELFRVTRGYVLASSQTDTIKTDEMPYPVYSSQTKDKGLMGYYKDYLYEDAITWTTDGANAGTVNYRAGKFYCTNVCGVLLSNEVKANQMIAEALNNVAKGYVSYVGNPKLMNNVMADIVIHIPTKAEERELLSSLFSNLDNLITLHQRRLDTLMQCKNGMLQQLFI